MKSLIFILASLALALSFTSCNDSRSISVQALDHSDKLTNHVVKHIHIGHNTSSVDSITTTKGVVLIVDHSIQNPNCKLRVK